MMDLVSLVKVLFKVSKVGDADGSSKCRGKVNPYYSKAMQDGLCSATFDITDNVCTDTRPGLDGGDQVRGIMAEDQCSFDEARLLQFYRKCCENNIDPHSGLPLDPKAGFFPPPPPTATAVVPSPKSPTCATY